MTATTTYTKNLTVPQYAESNGWALIFPEFIPGFSEGRSKC
jgi:hypothetical protein